MPYFIDNEKNFSVPYFPIHPHRIPAVYYAHASEPYVNRFQKTLSDLTRMIPSIFSNPSQHNIKKLINILDAIKGNLKHLNIAPTQQKSGISITSSLITILNSQPFLTNSVYVELQNLLNFSLSITKSFKMNRYVSKNILEQTKKLQINLLQTMPIGMNDQLQDEQEYKDEYHTQEEFEFLDEHCPQNELELLDAHCPQNELELLDAHCPQNELELLDAHCPQNELELLDAHCPQNELELLDEHCSQNELELLDEHCSQNELELLDEQEHQEKQLQENKEELISLHLPV
ncbi:collagen-like repeat preface domain-containing protein [Bacillus sp. BP-3]|uniref:collagen-like repeat preface domain-containing protein n=1 Tax=Bacillus sp. BP-3 TaxID=3022773 RepID=UPI00232D4613|nr:collagen-like repeat preface domain-containing protein [Bacillus sp. BP-3]MDC2864582.1 collagen-like repeat preface domain-containing protein [Bacillus sp. BP-3]